MADEWVWSHDGERFGGGPEESKSAALDQARVEGATHIGRKVDYQPFDWDVVEHLLEQEGCESYETVGEIADSWPPHVDKEERKEARDQIATIMRNLVGEPDFYKVVDVETVTDEKGA
jgi:hypothetical protein